MNLKRIGKRQKNILKLLSVKGANILKVTDYRCEMKISFTVNYDSEMIGGDDCGDSFDIDEKLFDSLLMREGLFQKMNHPTSLDIDIEAYELTDDARKHFSTTVELIKEGIEIQV